MKLVEHIQHVITLVDQGAAPANIKASLTAMYEEADGYDRRASDQIKLDEEHAKAMAAAESENARLLQKNAELVNRIHGLEEQLRVKRAKKPLDKESRAILERLSREAEGMTVEEIAEAVACEKGEANYRCEDLRESGFIDRVRFHGDQRRIYGPDSGYCINQTGQRRIRRRSG